MILFQEIWRGNSFAPGEFWSVLSGASAVPAPNVGPGKICSQSSITAAPGWDKEGSSDTIWNHGHSFGFYLGKDPLKNPPPKLYPCQNPTNLIRTKSKAC